MLPWLRIASLEILPSAFFVKSCGARAPFNPRKYPYPNMRAATGPALPSVSNHDSVHR